LQTLELLVPASLRRSKLAGSDLAGACRWQVCHVAGLPRGKLTSTLPGQNYGRYTTAAARRNKKTNPRSIFAIGRNFGLWTTGVTQQSIVPPARAGVD
jgi:hypothetical protein